MAKKSLSNVSLQEGSIRFDLLSSIRTPIRGFHSGLGLSLTFSFLFLLSGLFLSSCSQGNGKFSYKTGTENIPGQRFSINSDQNEVISGTNSSIFAIPSGAFLDAMGNTVSGNIEIHLKEANRPLEILAGGLITQAGNSLLASNGMYMLEAFQNGQALSLNPQVGIYAYLPTQKKDPNMGLYVGKFSEDKLDWVLSEEGEQGIPDCDKDKESRKQCRRCDNLLKMAKHLKTEKKPDENEYWAKRHYWEGGVLYFASSGSRQPILSQKQLNDCKAQLQNTEKGRDLLAKVGEIKARQQENVGDYYSYRLNNLGWHNIDKLVKEELVTFSGKVLDEDGNPAPGVTVHLLSKEPDLLVHSQTTALDGSYAMQFVTGREFAVYSYQQNKVAQLQVRLNSPNQEVEALALHEIGEAEADAFLSSLTQ